MVRKTSNQEVRRAKDLSSPLYGKGVPLGLPISQSIFNNLLQNLEGKFKKAVAKVLLISSYLHCMDPADPFGNPSWSSETHMNHPLWPLPWNSWCSRDAGISNHDSQRRVGAQAFNRCTQVGTAWPPWQWQRGCCTTPTNTLTQWFIVEFTHSQGEMCWSTFLLKWHLLHNPIVAGFWYNIIPHLIHVTPLTVPSKEIWANDITGSYSCTIIMCGGWSYISRM